MPVQELAQHWLARAGDADVARALRRVYAIVAGEVHLRAPVCNQSGRCCHFDAWDHRLYATGLETAFTLLNVPSPSGHGAEATPPSASASPAPDSLTPTALAAARARGGCPFQFGTLCTVHTVRPLGCRLYYCDPAWQPWQESLAERTHAAIREIHDEHDIEYRYGEWRDMLGMFLK